MDAKVYVSLLDEGTFVIRPVRAVPLGGDVYRLVCPIEEDPARWQYDPDLEHWEFEPGSVVLVRWENRSVGRVCIADRLHGT